MRLSPRPFALALLTFFPGGRPGPADLPPDLAVYDVGPPRVVYVLTAGELHAVLTRTIKGPAPAPGPTPTPTPDPPVPTPTPQNQHISISLILPKGFGRAAGLLRSSKAVRDAAAATNMSYRTYLMGESEITDLNIMAPDGPIVKEGERRLLPSELPGLVYQDEKGRILAKSANIDANAAARNTTPEAVVLETMKNLRGR